MICRCADIKCCEKVAFFFFFQEVVWGSWVHISIVMHCWHFGLLMSQFHILRHCTTPCHYHINKLPTITITNSELCSSVFCMYMGCVACCVYLFSRWAHFSCLWRVIVKRTTGCGALRQSLCRKTSGSSCSHSLSGWSCWTTSSETQVRVCLCWHFSTQTAHQSNFVEFLFLHCWHLYWLTDFGSDKTANHYLLLK